MEERIKMEKKYPKMTAVIKHKSTGVIEELPYNHDHYEDLSKSEVAANVKAKFSTFDLQEIKEA
jgi:hypothetical protein